MSELPTGTITFLFTDIEGSTKRWERYPEEMRLALARHDELLQEGVNAYSGVVFKTVGDAFYVAFTTAGAAVSAAVVIQRALYAEQWDLQLEPLRVRMAIHTGEAERRSQDYFGQSLNRVARILSAGHGGQVLLSLTTAGLIREMLPPGISMQNLGEHRLKDIQLPEQIFQLNIDVLPTHFSPLKTLDRQPNNLPTQLTSFVGRKKDVEAISTLLHQEDVRLVTLVGPGGTGKTRLGLQVAAEVADAFSDGVYYIDLAATHDTQGVVSAIAQAIGVHGMSNQPVLESLKEYLQGNALLFIDNFEQVVEAAPLIHEMLVADHKLKVLVTSRSALHLGGEHEYHVVPLAVPRYKRLPELTELAQNESVALFIQQARAVKPDFHLNSANAAAVAEICVRLDGLPLAIELAAARVNLLPPQSMVKRLGRRLQLLTGGKRNQSARQQTLRGAIDWSFNLLETHEKGLFCQLAVFFGGCTLEAIEAVCFTVDSWDGDILDVLRSLIDKSLLRLREWEHGEPRFEMLYTIREYALEQLVEKELTQLQLRHAEYYLQLVEHIGHPPVGIEQKHWMASLEVEHENIQSALSWYVEQRQVESGLRMAEALWHFWWLRGLLHEARKWFERLLAVQHGEGLSPTVKARVLERMSELACWQNDYVNASMLAEEALLISQQLDDKEMISRAYIALAGIASRQKEYARAISLLEESLKFRQALGDTRGMASLLNNLGNVVRQQGELDRSAALHEKSLSLFRQVGDSMAIAAVLNNMAEIEWQRAHYVQAEILYKESLKLCHTLRYTWGIASSLVGLGDVACHHDNYESAMRMYRESLTLFQEMDDPHGISACLEGLAEVIYKQNQPEVVMRFLGQAEVSGYTMEIGTSQQYTLSREIIVERLRKSLGTDEFESLWATEYAPFLEQVINEALDGFLKSHD